MYVKKHSGQLKKNTEHAEMMDELWRKWLHIDQHFLSP